MKIHPVIHGSNLKPYHLDPNDDIRNFITRFSVDLKQDTKEVETILVDRVRKVGRLVWKIREFLVKWKNLHAEKSFDSFEQERFDAQAGNALMT